MQVSGTSVEKLKAALAEVCRGIFSRSRYPFFLRHWEQRTGGNPKLVGMSEHRSVDV